MLSKLFHSQFVSSYVVDQQVLAVELSREIQKTHSAVTIHPCESGGTSGVFFCGQIDGRKRFVKTHHPTHDALMNLKKEICIYEVLYRDILEIETAEVLLGGYKYICLIMDWLDELKQKPEPGEVRDIIRGYQKRISSRKIASEYSHKQILEESDRAFNVLRERKLISKDTISSYQNIIESSNALVNDDVLCHGDLGNKNIMVKQGELVIIDWEDAFWGTSDYDFYYWLTFFDQRALYSSEWFDFPGIDRDECVAYMARIVMLKSYLSYLNGAYTNNSLTFDERLSEIFALAE